MSRLDIFLLNLEDVLPKLLHKIQCHFDSWSFIFWRLFVLSLNPQGPEMLQSCVLGRSCSSFCWLLNRPLWLRNPSSSFLEDVLCLYFWCSLPGISTNKTLSLPNLSLNFLLSATFHLFVLLFYFLGNFLNFIFLSLYSNFNFYKHIFNFWKLFLVPWICSVLKGTLCSFFKDLIYSFISGMPWILYMWSSLLFLALFLTPWSSSLVFSCLGLLTFKV